MSVKEDVLALLADRGVTVEAIGLVVLEVQRGYYPDLTLAECVDSVEAVLEKREVQNALLTGLALDQLAERDLLPEPLLGIVKRDDGLYGVDEILALAITNVYGSIGLTNFGYLDKMKIGIIGELHGLKGQRVNTFLDDLVSGVAAAAAARIAHRHGGPVQRPVPEEPRLPQP